MIYLSKLCILFCVTKKCLNKKCFTLIKNYLQTDIIAAMNLITWGPLYTCLVLIGKEIFHLSLT